jgi:PAS domain S-box-containing protein
MPMDEYLTMGRNLQGVFMKGYERIAVQITNLLRSHPRGMTITGISQALSLNRNSVAKYLEILVTSGQVEKQRIGRAKLFFLSQRVPLSAMLNLSSDMILILDDESRIWYVNDNLLAFEGEAREELLGRDPAEVLPGIFQDAEISARIGAPLRDEFRKELCVPIGGETRHFTISLVPTTLEDGSRGITVIIGDITERKRAEEALKEHLRLFQELLDRVPVPVFYKDTEGRYLGCNHAFELYTRKTREEILHRKASQVVPPGLAEKFEAMDALALETGQIQSFETIYPVPDGPNRDIIVYKAPYPERDGSPAGIVGTIIDTTSHRLAGESLRKRIQELEAGIHAPAPCPSEGMDEGTGR